MTNAHLRYHAQFLLQLEMFRTKVVEKIKTHILCSVTFFFRKLYRLWENVGKYRRMRLKRDGTRAETRFSLSAKRTSPFKSAGASVQSTTGIRVARISGSNAGYTTFRGSVNSTGYQLHSPVSPSLPLPCVTVWHHISTGLLEFIDVSECPEYEGRRFLWNVCRIRYCMTSGHEDRNL